MNSRKAMLLLAVTLAATLGEERASPAQADGAGLDIRLNQVRDKDYPWVQVDFSLQNSDTRLSAEQRYVAALRAEDVCVEEDGHAFALPAGSPDALVPESKQKVPLPTRLLLAVDWSGSMLGEEPTGEEGKKKSKAARAKEAITASLDRMRKDVDQAALLFFWGDRVCEESTQDAARAVDPNASPSARVKSKRRRCAKWSQFTTSFWPKQVLLSPNRRKLEDTLQQQEPPRKLAGTPIRDAIIQAIDWMQTAPSSQQESQQMIILFTDGHEVGSERSVRELTDKCKGVNYPIYLYAIGNPSLEPGTTRKQHKAFEAFGVDRRSFEEVKEACKGKVEVTYGEDTSKLQAFIEQKLLDRVHGYHVRYCSPGQQHGGTIRQVGVLVRWNGQVFRAPDTRAYVAPGIGALPSLERCVAPHICSFGGQPPPATVARTQRAWPLLLAASLFLLVFCIGLMRSLGPLVWSLRGGVPRAPGPGPAGHHPTIRRTVEAQSEQPAQAPGRFRRVPAQAPEQPGSFRRLGPSEENKEPNK